MTDRGVTSSDDGLNSDARSVDFFRKLVDSSSRVFVRVWIHVALRADVRRPRLRV